MSHIDFRIHTFDTNEKKMTGSSFRSVIGDVYYYYYYCRLDLIIPLKRSHTKCFTVIESLFINDSTPNKTKEWHKLAAVKNVN